jgi:hypothetical protein
MSKKRLEENNIMIDNNIRDNFNIIIEKYAKELSSYKFIDNVTDFSLLTLKGSMRYINKYDKKLRYGGLLIKIYEKDNKYFAMIKRNKNIYNVSFDSNLIFYIKNKDEHFKDNLKYFINQVESNQYELE